MCKMARLNIYVLFVKSVVTNPIPAHALSPVCEKQPNIGCHFILFFFAREDRLGVHNNGAAEKQSKQNHSLSINRRFIYRAIVFMCYASLCANFAASLGLLYCSSHNYPGGEAISKLNSWPGLAETHGRHLFHPAHIIPYLSECLLNNNK